MIRDSSSDQVARAMREDSRDTHDVLLKIREAVSRWRDLDAEVSDLEQRLAAVKQERLDVERQVLPDLFAQSGVDRVDVPADGNLPAVEASLSDFCRASIPASWPHPRRAEAFRVLESLGLESLIRSTVSVELDRGDVARARAVTQMLEGAGLRPNLSMGVHHASLTSAVRELCQEGRRPDAAELEAIGAAVGKTVRLKFK